MRVVKTRRVPVGRADANAKLIAFLQLRIPQLDIARHTARVHADGGDPTHGLFKRQRIKCRVCLHLRQLPGIGEQTQDHGQDRIARLVQPTTDNDVHIGPDLFKRMGMFGVQHARQDRRVLRIAMMWNGAVYRRRNRCRCRFAALRDMRITCVIPHSIHQRLRPDTHIAPRHILFKTQQFDQRIGCKRSGEIVKQLRLALILHRGDQSVSDSMEFGGPMILDHLRFESRFQSLALNPVILIILAHQRMTHDLVHQGAGIGRGEIGMVAFDMHDVVKSRDEIKTGAAHPNRRSRLTNAVKTRVRVRNKRIE